MPKFLNTHGLSDWMGRIIDETQHELIIISPYLQISNILFQKLLNADKRGVEVIFIYRTLNNRGSIDDYNNKKSNLEYELGKLKAIDNLNLMHHPNIHAKCMYNENYLLVASMNFYEYSEKNNREMGVLFHKNHLPEFTDDGWGDNSDDELIFEEALEEIIEIKNGAEMERASSETIKEGFELNILKNSQEKREEFLKLVNKIFIHKKFILDAENRFLCKSYIDRVDILWDYRIEFNLKFEASKIKSNYSKYYSKIKELEYMIEGFKIYWNKPECIYLYDDLKHSLWKRVNNETDEIQLRKKGVEEMINFIKSI